MKAIIHNIRISAISACLPTNVQELMSLSGEFGEKEVASIIKATGVERVRLADNKQTASDLCYEAATYLLKEEQIERNKIDGLVFVSQTADYTLPSTSVILQDRLGLTRETVCIDIHYGCSGYIYGLFQAALWINSGGCENVLLLAGDTSSKMINARDKSLRMVFGDCGTATLVTRGTASIGFSVCSDGSGYDRLIIPAGGFRLPSSEETKMLLFDEDRNGRTQEDMFMDGMAIFDFAITNVPQNVNDLIEQMQWRKEDIALFAMHQANKFMVNCIRKKIMVEAEKMPVNIANYGNTGPASIPLLLSDVCSVSQYDLDKVILSGFGVGLSWGSVACSLCDTHFYEPLNK